MASWLILTLCLVVLVWDLRVIVPGLILIAVGFVAFLPGVQARHMVDLVGIALVPVIGGMVYGVGNLRQVSRLKPPWTLRILGALALLLAPWLLQDTSILPFLPAPLQELAVLRMMFRLLLAGGLFLSLAEAPVYFGYGLLLLILLVNALVFLTYDGTAALLFLLNLLELATILALGQQALRFPLWLSVQREHHA